jgi:hypothetical protein
MTDPKLISGQYWTDWFADYIAGAISRRDDAANRLITAIAWFWTVYTATALVGTALGSRASLSAWQVLLILCPIVTLLLSYLCTLWTLNPIVGDTTQTEAAAKALWGEILRKKLFRLRLASCLLVASALVIVYAGYIVARSKGLSVG